MTDISINGNGMRLAASVHGAQDAPPIVFLHGISHSRDTWSDIVARLSDRYQVWTLDFRGHGHSDRAQRYEMIDYLDDAQALLKEVGRPAVLVGHSLGACIAGMLAQRAHPLVRAVLLEEPPWFLGEASEWEQTAVPRIFAAIQAQQALWQRQEAPLATWLAFVSKAPSSLGGTGVDHLSARHLLSHASGLQRQDNLCWRDAGLGATQGAGLSAIDTTQPFQCVAKVVIGEARLGSAFLDAHVGRLTAVNPGIDILRYAGCGHDPHRTFGHEDRFIGDLEAFLETAS